MSYEIVRTQHGWVRNDEGDVLLQVCVKTYFTLQSLIYIV
jgi:hypothetical protein